MAKKKPSITAETLRAVDENLRGMEEAMQRARVESKLKKGKPTT